MKTIIILFSLHIVYCGNLLCQETKKPLPIKVERGKNSTSYTVGCTYEEKVAPLEWVYSEYKRTGKKVQKVRSSSDVYKYFSKEAMVDSFFVNPNRIKPEHEILQIVPLGLGKKYFDCKVIEMQELSEERIWGNGFSKAKNLKDFFKIVNQCPTTTIIWADKYLLQYKTDLPGLLQMIHKRSLLLFKNKGVISPTLLKNTEQFYFDIINDKNKILLL